MKTVVCVKQVKVLGDEVEFTDDARDVDPDYVESVLNEWDAYATEEALLLRERLLGEVVALTCGDPDAEKALRRCLAMGADRAIRVEGLAERDPISVARALADVVRAESPELVLCGVQSSDSVQAAVPTALAELLGLPRVAVVTRLDWSGSGPATAHRELEGGLIDVVEVSTPAVVTIQTGLNQPRYANLRAIKQAEQVEIDVRQAEGGTPGYRVRRMFVPSKGEGAEMLTGGPAEIAARVAEIVQERLR